MSKMLLGFLGAETESELIDEESSSLQSFTRLAHISRERRAERLKLFAGRIGSIHTHFTAMLNDLGREFI